MLLLFSATLNSSGQISPGPLAEGHKHLEGMSNCTQCHSIGDKVPNQKCLDCHKEISTLIKQKKGYHANKEVTSKTCVDCHNDHHGRKFEMARFDEKTFDHNKAGYALKGKHKPLDCRECHKPDLIKSPSIKKLDGTYLGMGTTCIDCHDDYHQGTLANECTQCHTQNEWKPVTLFDHNKADFQLKGAHQTVDCIACHKETVKNGKKFQEFGNIPFAKCTDCHTDQHKGEFGTRCTDCHNETSWTKLNANNTFNHNLTNYPLRGMHANVDCRSCHKTEKYSTPIAHAACKNCHTDYHRGEFTRKKPASDCADCHTVEKKFSYTLYGVDEHQELDFKLTGGHLATPCFSCHVSEDKWTFSNLGERCVDCHTDVHKGYISEQYYPKQECTACHTTATWTAVTFEHSKTNWKLEGRHKNVDCRQCHLWDKDRKDIKTQQFKFADKGCATCHTNVHGSQFEENGKTDCASCHTVDRAWNNNNFNHEKTKFPLEGKHREVDCRACHKATFKDGTTERIDYKIERFECKDCHTS